MDETWTIAELAERATTALAGLAPANGRVRDVPNERLIRYYTTIGLLDPPLARRGRIALYGRRHLLQLVAVKRRQAEGVSIAALQAELVGATNTRLAELAGTTLPPATPDTVSSRQAADPPPPVSRQATDSAASGSLPPAVTEQFSRQTGNGTPTSPPAIGRSTLAEPRPRFWADRPATAAPPDRAPGPVSSTSPALDSSPPPAFPLAFHGVSLTPAAALLLTRPLSDDERVAVARAAQPLIDLLTDLGLSEGMPS